MNNLAKTIHPTTGNASLINVVRHLRGSLHCATHTWDPLQREAAEMAVAEAEELLGIETPILKVRLLMNEPVKIEGPHLKLVDTRPLYKREFPGFPTITEAIPEGFKDSSWHNNTCPSFSHEYPDGGALHIHLDWPNPDQRDAGPHFPRYSLWLQHHDGYDVGEAVVSNDWQEIITAIGLFPEIKV